MGARCFARRSPPRPRGCLPTCCLGCRFWGAARSTPSTLRFASCAATGQSAGPEKPERFAFPQGPGRRAHPIRSEEHTSELQSRENLVCRLLLEKKKKKTK